MGNDLQRSEEEKITQKNSDVYPIDILKMYIRLKPPKDIQVQKLRIGRIPILILRSKESAPSAGVPGVLWIHGGGYFVGMKEMVYMSRAVDLIRDFGAVVLAPGYRQAILSPYPAAIEDCYQSLRYMKEHAKELGIREDLLMVGGESSGGGLTAALCMMARDRGEVNIAFQMPLYPMMDNFDTESSKDNHGRLWNTRRNHLGWRMYLRKDTRKEVSPYAAAARQTDYRKLPPAYTFVGDGEPFYSETLSFIEKLKEAGVPAEADVYHTDYHAFDMLRPELPESKAATEKFLQKFQYAEQHYSAPQEKI